MENSKKNQAVQVSNSYWIKVVAIFFVGWILMYATRTIFNPVMGVIGEQFGLSNTQLGLANSIFFLTYAVAQIPFGMIGDKIGRKLVIAVGFIVLAISTYFSIMAIPTFIVGILFYTILKEKVIRPGEEAARAAAEEGPQEKISLKEIFSNRNLLAAFILCFTSIYANFVIITWLPQFLIAERGFTGASVGFISSLVPWASIPGALIFARLNDKTGATKKLVFTLVPLAILSVFAIAFVTNRTLLISVLILYGLTGKLALDPIMVTFVTKHAPKAALGTTLSAYNFIGMSGSILAPYVTGYLADTAGSMQVGFYLSCVLLVIGLLAFAFLAKDESKPKLG